MTPTPITVPLTNPACPVTFTLSGTGELELKSVQATVDGSAAGSTFDAVLSIYTQDDKLISRTKPSTSISAGGSAIVTWAPFLRKPAAAASGGGLTTMFRVHPAVDQTVASGASPQVLWGATDFNQGSAFTTADNKTFTLALGIWLITVVMLITDNASPNTNTATRFEVLNGASMMTTKHFWLDAIANGGGRETFTLTFLKDGSGSALALNVKLFNFEAGNIILQSPGDFSWMEGVLLLPA